MHLRIRPGTALSLLGGALCLWASLAWGLYHLLPQLAVPVAPRLAATHGTRPGALASPLAPEFGVFVADFAGDPEYSLNRATALGVSWVAIEIRWGEWQFFPTTPLDWSALDRFMAAARRRDLRVLARLLTSPAWSNPSGALDAPPADLELYADFAARLASRYPGTLGALELWAQENTADAWNTPEGVNARDYRSLVELTRDRVKPVAPQVLLISGALAAEPAATPRARSAGTAFQAEGPFLAEFLSMGDPLPVDCIGIQHLGRPSPDTPLSERLTAHAEWVGRRIPLCLTALGFSNLPGDSPARAEQTQADHLAEAVYNLALPNAPRVKLAIVFNLDAASVTGDAGEIASRFSLLDPAGQPRPAYVRLQQLLNQ